MRQSNLYNDDENHLCAFMKPRIRGVTSEKQMLMYGKEASNRKQEINRQHHTIPNQRPKDKHYGNVHSQLYTFPRMPTMALL